MPVVMECSNSCYISFSINNCCFYNRLRVNLNPNCFNTICGNSGRTVYADCSTNSRCNSVTSNCIHNRICNRNSWFITLSCYQNSCWFKSVSICRRIRIIFRRVSVFIYSVHPYIKILYNIGCRSSRSIYRIKIFIKVLSKINYAARCIFRRFTVKCNGPAACSRILINSFIRCRTFSF